MNNRLNEYLRELETHLRFLPAADRDSEIAEITAHFAESIAQKIASGQTEDAATAEAITQFGKARDVGSRLYQAGKHKRFAGLWETALFCAAFSTLLSLVQQMVSQVVQGIVYQIAVRTEPSGIPPLVLTINHYFAAYRPSLR